MGFGYVLGLLLFMFFDVYYILRAVLVTVVCKCMRYMKRLGIFEEAVYYGICLSTDLDLYGHMNNARYLRECDFGRYELWIKNGIFDAARNSGGYITLGGSTIRYRKSINLFDTYTIRSKVLCWDDKAFYLDQRFVRRKDGFVMAVVLLKQTIKGDMTPADLVKVVEGHEVESPPIPDHVTKWIECNEISSAELRKQD